MGIIRSISALGVLTFFSLECCGFRSIKDLPVSDLVMDFHTAAILGRTNKLLSARLQWKYELSFIGTSQ